MLPEIETENTFKVQQLQEEKLRKQIAHVAENSPFYQRVFRENGIDPEGIQGLKDLEQLPTTTKDDLQNFNDDFVCVPSSKVIDQITTSGTLGDPVTFLLTDQDLDRLAYNEALSFACAGCDEQDVMQLMTTIDRRFMAGLAYWLGARKLGAGMVRVGSGVPPMQWDSIHRAKPNVLITVPSFLLKLIEYARENGIDHENSSVEKAICIGEPIRNPDMTLNTLGRKIKEQWDLELYSTYASTEMSTAFTECSAGRGGHHHPELLIVEFLDEEGNAVPEGEPGEVTVTTLGVEGMPLLRYRTGDICERYNESCSCGLTTMRLGPVIGRKKQMIKYKGTTLYPPALYDILNNIDGVKNYLVEVFTNDTGTDEILVHVGSERSQKELAKVIKDHFRTRLRVAPSIKFSGVKEIEKQQFNEMNRKPVKFIDRRETNFVS